MKMPPIFLLVLLFTGCAHRPPPVYTEAQTFEYNSPIDCASSDECERLWRGAQAWVVQHSAFKIQVATNSIIQTFNPPTYSTGWAFQVVRTPITKATERISISPNCGEVPLCRGTKYELVAAFHATLRKLKE